MNPMNKTHVVFRGNLIEIIHQEFETINGKKIFEIARRGPGTRIILVSTNNQILITREYRTELNNYDIRLPGGKVFDSLYEFENALAENKPMIEFAKEAAIRELKEETGFITSNMEFITISRCGATIEWDIYYFLCTNWNPPEGKVIPHEDEDITTLWENFENIKELCLNGNISEERSAIQLLRYIYKTENQ